MLGVTVWAGLAWWLGDVFAWRVWGIPSGMPRFMDLHALTIGAKAYQEGLDPMYSNPHDITGRLVNYPRVWQLIYRVGLDEGDTWWMGGCLLLLFIATLVAVTPPMENRQAGWFTLAVFSPAVLFACERGNTDLLIFALLAVAVAARGGAWAMVAVLAAFVLKLFPLAASLVALKQERRAAIAWLVGALAFAILYLSFSLGDIVQIVSTTPRSGWVSYGKDVIWLKLQAWDPAAGGWLRLPGNLLAAGWMIWVGLTWWRGALPAQSGELPATITGFRAGAACYVATFLIGTSFDYKLMFLLLALPQLQAWSADRTGALATPARVALISLYYSLWRLLLDKLLAAAGVPDWPGFIIAEAAHWVLYAALVYLVAATLPEWVRGLAHDICGRRPAG